MSVEHLVVVASVAEPSLSAAALRPVNWPAPNSRTPTSGTVSILVRVGFMVGPSTSGTAESVLGGIAPKLGGPSLRVCRTSTDSTYANRELRTGVDVTLPQVCCSSSLSPSSGQQSRQRQRCG